MVKEAEEAEEAEDEEDEEDEVEEEDPGLGCGLESCCPSACGSDGDGTAAAGKGTLAPPGAGGAGQKRGGGTVRAMLEHGVIGDKQQRWGEAVERGASPGRRHL